MMMLFLLTCLLVVFPVLSMKSPIFGPAEVDKFEGSSASIKCFYPATSVNQHSRKYWCRQESQGSCTTLISDSYISKNYQGRAKLTHFPKNNTFVVDIAHLTKNDSGHYKCGLGINNRGLSFDINLQVNQDPILPDGTKIYKTYMGGTVAVDCTFKAENSEKLKSVCKKSNQGCVLVINSSGYINPNYENRAQLFIYDTSAAKYKFIIKKLQLTDAGTYECQAGDYSTDDKDNAYLHVLKPEPELAYGDLRGSVMFDCALDPKTANEAKFLCRMNNEKSCDVVINTLGKKAQDFEGRILLTPKNNGYFSVLMTGLRKEDAGHYLCGASPHGQLKEDSPTQAWQLFINEETVIPPTPSVVKGVEGGSVAVLCPYNPKEKDNLKFWCRWKDTPSGSCPQLVKNGEISPEQIKNYEGKLAMHEEPGNGTYTIMFNQLTTEDAGFYWCLTNGDIHWTSMVELKVVKGEIDLKVPKNVIALEGENIKIPCHVPCKFYSYDKYWCKWTNKGCRTFPSQDEGPSQAFTECTQKSQLINLVLNSVTKKDEGWYWCGVKNSLRYGDSVAVYVTVNKVSQDVSQVNADPQEEAIEPGVRTIENKAIQNPSLLAEGRAVEETRNSADDSRASTDPESSVGQGRNSSVVVYILVPLALVLTLGAVALGVARARHRRNVDRISIRSYRTDISMSDLENSKDFGAIDNMGASPIKQETSLGGKDESMSTTRNTMETDEPKKVKRSSKEEADMAYTAFLIQSNNMAANTHDSPSEA